MLAVNTRRQFILGGAAALAGSGVLIPGSAGARIQRRRARLWARPDLLIPDADQAAALRVLRRSQMRAPGSLPNPALKAGTDTIPQIEHVVVLMMENHSYDNFIGMLGRGPFQTPRGDGYTIAADGYPANSNPQADGTPLRAFHMPTTCQLSGKPSQEWTASHQQYDNGKNDGFVTSPSGPVAMGYWTWADLPFTYDLATQFPIGDRYFCSVLGQTDPNRRYLIAATSSGMTDDVPSPSQDATLAVTPPNGTIFSRLSNAGISWAEYDVQYKDLTAETMNLYPSVDGAYDETNERSFPQFLSDAKAGTLPSFSLIDPNFGTQSQENPQNIVVGEAFLRSVVEAIGSSPNWAKTILFINYDEHGGYYDHVPPPVALAPDNIPPVTSSPSQSAYDGFKRYGFRVPCIVVGPYAKPGYVSHVVYDHTSVLAFVERKWNLPAMTMRDANANDMTDFLDLGAMSAGRPTFPELPQLAQSGDNEHTLMCSTTGPGVIPPSTQPAPLPIQIALDYGGISKRDRGALVTVQASRGSLTGVSVELRRDGKVVARDRLARLTVVKREVVLRVRGKPPSPGEYTAFVVQGGRPLAHKTIEIR